MVEDGCSDVVQVAQQREETAALLVIPYFYFVVVTTGDEHGLRAVKMNAADGTIVLVKFLDQRAHAVIPQLDDAVVQRSEDPWPLRVKREALNAGRFSLKFCQHFRRIIRGGGGRLDSFGDQQQRLECGGKNAVSRDYDDTAAVH